MQFHKDEKSPSLFRQEALERLSSPEQLDQMVEIVNPMAWIPLGAIGCLAIAALLWSIFGRLPLNVKGQGILVRPHRVIQFQAPSNGQLLTLDIQSGTQVRRGQVLGTIDQSQVQEQLRQQQDKLTGLLSQTREKGTLQKRQLDLQRQNLQQQRRILETTLSDAEALAPVLRDKGLSSVAQNRTGLTTRLMQQREQLPVLRQRIDVRKQLVASGALSQDSLLQVQQEYFDRVGQVTELETQLQELQVRELETQQQYLQNQSSIKETQNKLEDLATQEVKLTQQAAEDSFGNKNNVDEVRRQVAQLQLQLSTQGKIVSPYDGRVLEVALVPGQMIQTGSLVGSIQAEDQAEDLISLTFFADRDGKQLKPGMVAQITPSISKREQFGGIVGQVTDVTPYPVTSSAITALVGNPELAKQLAGEAAPVQVKIHLNSDANTYSKYQWTSSKGPQQTLSSGTTAAVQVRIGEIAPIAYVIPLFRSWTGVY